jgi:hypothetical protein
MQKSFSIRFETKIFFGQEETEQNNRAGRRKKTKKKQSKYKVESPN